MIFIGARVDRPQIWAKMCYTTALFTSQALNKNRANTKNNYVCVFTGRRRILCMQFLKKKKKRARKLHQNFEEKRIEKAAAKG